MPCSPGAAALAASLGFAGLMAATGLSAAAAVGDGRGPRCLKASLGGLRWLGNLFLLVPPGLVLVSELPLLAHYGPGLTAAAASLRGACAAVLVAYHLLVRPGALVTYLVCIFCVSL